VEPARPGATRVQPLDGSHKCPDDLERLRLDDGGDLWASMQPSDIVIYPR
jgi:hypothetical protein